MAVPDPGELDQFDRDILDFERTHVLWLRAGTKDQAVRARFGLSSTVYHQRLNRLLDRPEALVYAPDVVYRLRRVRESRTGRLNRR